MNVRYGVFQGRHLFITHLYEIAKLVMVIVLQNMASFDRGKIFAGPVKRNLVDIWHWPA